MNKKISDFLRKFVVYAIFWAIAYSFFISIKLTSIEFTLDVLNEPDFRWTSLYFGSFIGAVFLSFMLTFFDEILFPKRLQRSSFSLNIAIKTFTYFIIINITIYLVFFYFSFFREFDSKTVRIFFKSGTYIGFSIFGLVCIALLNFFRQMFDYIGKRKLFRLISGYYHKPRKEERVFMFLDIKSSTTLAESMGEIEYSRMLTDFFHDISMPIKKFGGSIYQYVGDEAVITWLKNDGISNSACVECFFAIEDVIIERSDIYLEKFGVVPEFRAGMHAGPVVTTEVGTLKKDIVHHGDTVNTASRIQEECSARGLELLISSNLFELLNLPYYFSLKMLGEISLKGREEPIELLSITYTG